MKRAFVLTFLFASIALANANPLQQNSAGNDAVPATTGASLTLSPTTLSFGVQLLNKLSATKTINLMNVGSTALSIAKLFVTGNFRIQASTCGTTLAAGAPCTVTIVFQPAGTLNRYGNLWIYDNGGGSPQKVAWTGVGI